MVVTRDILSAFGLVVIILVGHVATSDNGTKDVKDAISGMGKAINDLIRWINRQ